MDTFSKSDPMCVLYRKVRNIILLSLLMFVDAKMEFHAFLIQDENEQNRTEGRRDNGTSRILTTKFGDHFKRKSSHLEGLDFFLQNFISKEFFCKFGSRLLGQTMGLNWNSQEAYPLQSVNENQRKRSFSDHLSKFETYKWTHATSLQ